MTLCDTGGGGLICEQSLIDISNPLYQMEVIFTFFEGYYEQTDCSESGMLFAKSPH